MVARAHTNRHEGICASRTNCEHFAIPRASLCGLGLEQPRECRGAPERSKSEIGPLADKVQRQFCVISLRRTLLAEVPV